jgi:hypothetical protein
VNPSGGWKRIEMPPSASARHPKRSAHPRERFLSPSVGWIGNVGHDGSDRCAVTGPAENIPEQCIIRAKPLHIGDQHLGRDSIGFVAHIHNDQSSMFDPFGTAQTPPSTRPVGAAATCGLPRCLPASSCAHPRPAAGPPDEVSSLTPDHFVDPRRHAVRTAQLVLPRVHPSPAAWRRRPGADEHTS